MLITKGISLNFAHLEPSLNSSVLLLLLQSWPENATATFQFRTSMQVDNPEGGAIAESMLWAFLRPKKSARGPCPGPQADHRCKGRNLAE